MAINKEKWRAGIFTGLLILDVGALVATLMIAKLDFAVFIFILSVEAVVAAVLLFGVIYHFVKLHHDVMEDNNVSPIVSGPPQSPQSVAGWTIAKAEDFLRRYDVEDLSFEWDKTFGEMEYNLTIQNQKSQEKPINQYPSASAPIVGNKGAVIGYTHKIRLSDEERRIFQRALEILQSEKFAELLKKELGDAFKSIPADQVYFVKKNSESAEHDYIRILGLRSFQKSTPLKLPLPGHSKLFRDVQSLPSAMGFSESDYGLQLQGKWANLKNMEQVFLSHFGPARSPRDQLSELRGRLRETKAREEKKPQPILLTLLDLGKRVTIESGAKPKFYRVNLSQVPGRLLEQAVGNYLSPIPFNAFARLTKQYDFGIVDAGETATLSFDVESEVILTQVKECCDHYAQRWSGFVSFYHDKSTGTYTTETGLRIEDTTLVGDLLQLQRAGIIKKKTQLTFQANPLFQEILHQSLAKQKLISTRAKPVAAASRTALASAASSSLQKSGSSLVRPNASSPPGQG